MSYDVFHTQLFKAYSYFFLEIFVEWQKTNIPNITKHILITARFWYGSYYYFCPTSFSLHYFNTNYNYSIIKNIIIIILSNILFIFNVYSLSNLKLCNFRALIIAIIRYNAEWPNCVALWVSIYV